jgi:hypothetical protein
LSETAIREQTGEIRELASVEPDDIAGGWDWLRVLEVACWSFTPCAAGYLAHRLFREP